MESTPSDIGPRDDSPGGTRASRSDPANPAREVFRCKHCREPVRRGGSGGRRPRWLGKERRFWGAVALLAVAGSFLADTVFVPLVLLLVFVLFLWFYPWRCPACGKWQTRRAFRRQRLGRCVHCDYDLTGNVSGVCPECGEKIASIQQ